MMKPKIPIWLIVLLAFSFLVACNIKVAIVPTGATSLPLFPTPTTTAAPTATLRPTPDLQCTKTNCMDACISKIASMLKSNGVSPQTKAANPQNMNITPTVLAIYDVQGDQLGSPKFMPNIPADLLSYQQNIAAQQAVWNFFVALIPPDQRTEVSNFIISSDGKGGMLASVQQNLDDPKKWALNVDIVDATNPRNLTFTLIHEFGHLLTLNDTQVTMDSKVMASPLDMQLQAQESSSCPQFFTTNGCSQSNSYINQFYNTFWTKLYPEWSKINAQRNANGYFTLIGNFYQRHPTQFVTPYAATSPEEDIAESWARFVLTTKPQPDSISERKTLFFYDFPKLVQLRNQIVYGLCNYSQNK